jgi:ubiquinone/menaquinone biosynthesis C-methylase UbiE
MKASSFPEQYEQSLVGPLFRPFAEALVERACLKDGDAVLDIACGTGIVARLAKERLGRNGRVVGVDVNPQMLAVANAIAPEIEWREGNAGALPLATGETFQAVLCHQGLQFFPEKPAAITEMRRALHGEGRLLVAVWKSLDEAPFFRDTHSVAEQRLGAFVDRRHSLGDSAALQQLLEQAGFENVRVDGLMRTVRFTDVTAFVRLNAMALVGMSAASSRMTDEERSRSVDALVEASADTVRQYSTPDELVFELGANVAIANP